MVEINNPDWKMVYVLHTDCFYDWELSVAKEDVIPLLLFGGTPWPCSKTIHAMEDERSIELLIDLLHAMEGVKIREAKPSTRNPRESFQQLCGIWKDRDTSLGDKACRRGWIDNGQLNLLAAPLA